MAKASPDQKRGGMWIALAVLLFILVLLCIPAAIFSGRNYGPLAHTLILALTSLFATLLLVSGSKATAEGTVFGVRFSLTQGFAAFVIFFLVLGLLIPPRFTQTVRFRALEQGRIIPKDFDLVVYVPNADPVPRKGVNGEASMELSTAVESIPQLDFTCVGYNLRSQPPYSIINGIVNLDVIKSGPLPPTGPGGYPSPAVIPEIPKDEPPPGKTLLNPDEVSLRYRNISGDSLTLFPFDVHRYHKIRREDIHGGEQWMKFPFEASEEYESYNSFLAGKGWFCFVVREKDGKYTFLGCRNLFLQPVNYLTVDKGEDGYFAKFE
jgi:hypothetical protein